MGKVTPKTIVNCFKKTGVVMPDQSMPIFEEKSQTNDEDFESEHYCHVERNIPFDMHGKFWWQCSHLWWIIEDAILQDKSKNQEQANLHTYFKKI